MVICLFVQGDVTPRAGVVPLRVSFIKKNYPRLTQLWVESYPGVPNNMICIKQNMGRVNSELTFLTPLAENSSSQKGKEMVGNGEFPSILDIFIKKIYIFFPKTNLSVETGIIK